MSLLSIRIEELINESGESVQALAQMGNISRTTLQRVKSGERLPPKKFFQSMCRALRLSATEVEELETLLEIATVGEDVSFTRQKIIELIETISELTEYKIPFSKQIRLKEFDSKIKPHSQMTEIISGERKVLEIIRNCIDRELFLSENPQLKLALPYQKVYRYIFHQMMGNQKQLSLQDVINLKKEPDQDEKIGRQEISQLKYLIALSLLENVEHQSRYYYQSPDLNFEQSALFPYFMLTSESVITVSRDFKQAVLYNDPGIVKLHEDGYNRMQAYVESFIEESRDLLTIYSTKDIAKSKQVVEPLPCFAYYFTDDLLEKKIRKDFPYYEQLKKVACEFYGNFRKENPTMLNVFSLKNLRSFMLDGSLYFPEEVYTPFTPSERIMLVRQLRDDLYHDRRKTYALNDEKIFLNSAIEFVDEYSRIRLILHYYNNQKLVFKTIVLQEKNIVKAFDDFFDSLPGSKYVLAKEETIAEIDKLIKEKENK